MKGKEIMEKILYVIEGDPSEASSKLALLAGAFDDFEVDGSCTAVVVDADADGLDADVMPCAVLTAAHEGDIADSVVFVDDDGLYSADDAFFAGLVDARAIVIDAGDLASLPLSDIDSLAECVADRIPVQAIGRVIVMWSGADVERMGQELFVMGRLAAARIAFVKASREQDGEEPSLYYESEGDIKLACSLVQEGLFDGVLCRSASWNPMKVASLAQRMAE